MEAILKNIIIKIIFIFLWFGFTNNSFAHVYLDYPYGGETFQANTIITLQWHIAIEHEQLNWDLYFSSDGGMTWQPIQLDLPVSQLTYSWVVPSIATSQARISIIQDNVDMDYQDESMDFTIEPEPMTPFIDITAQDLNLECNTNTQQASIQDWLNSHGGAVAVGFCGNLVWTHDYIGLINDCGATGNAFVIFTASDECGSASTGAYLTVYDLNAPVIQTPAANMVVECGNPNNTILLNNWLSSHGGATASDGCSNVSWSYEAYPSTNGCGVTLSTSVVFTATDDCGNSITTEATFAVEDRIAPAIIIPAQDQSISCGGVDPQVLLQSWLNIHGGAMAFDDCGNMNWTNNYSALSDDCGPTGSAFVTFTVTDDCGNVTTTAANFSIIDNISPVINAPAKDTLINCSEINTLIALEKWLRHHGGATASDNCESVIWDHDFPSLPDTCEMTRSISVRFIATDECNNSDTTNAIVTLQRTTGTTDLNPGHFNFKISPNPVSDILKVDLGKTESAHVQIYLFDSHGRIVFSIMENESETYIPLNTYSPGLYFLQVATTKRVQTQKVVIY